MCSRGFSVLSHRCLPAEGAPPPRQPGARESEGSQKGVDPRCGCSETPRPRRGRGHQRGAQGDALPAPSRAVPARRSLSPNSADPPKFSAPARRLTSLHTARRSWRAAARVPGRRPRCARPDAALCLRRSLLPPRGGRCRPRRTPPARQPRACPPPSPPRRRRRRPLGRAPRPAIRGGDPPAQRPPPRAPRPPALLPGCRDAAQGPAQLGARRAGDPPGSPGRAREKRRLRAPRSNPLSIGVGGAGGRGKGRRRLCDFQHQSPTGWSPHPCGALDSYSNHPTPSPAAHTPPSPEAFPRHSQPSRPGVRQKSDLHKNVTSSQ